MFEWLKKAFGSKPSHPEIRNYASANVVSSKDSREVPLNAHESPRNEAVDTEPDAGSRHAGGVDAAGVAQGLTEQSDGSHHGRHRLNVKAEEASTDVEPDEDFLEYDNEDSQVDDSADSVVVNLDEEIESENNSVPSEGEDKESQLIDELTKEAEIYVEKQ